MSGGVAETGTVPAVSYLDTWFQRYIYILKFTTSVTPLALKT